MRPPPAPPFLLTINLAELNARQYPVLAFARQDGQRLERHFPDKRQAETKTRELLLGELNALTNRTDPLVVSITALALVRDENVYLVPGDADPDDDASLLDVRHVLDALGRCPAAHKLLILDIAHPLADGRLGVLTDRVAQTIEESLQRQPPNFFVLCSASADQVALRSEVLQCSVLTHYLDRGLQGEADADSDLRVTVAELFAYVRPRVERWAQLNRGRRQRPRLLGAADDFVLVGLSKNRPAPWERPALPAYPQALHDGWSKRDQWRDQGAVHRSPRPLMRLEANLLRYEALWRGGAIAPDDWDAFGREVARLEHDIAAAAAVQPIPVRSAALARLQSGAKDHPDGSGEPSHARGPGGTALLSRPDLTEALPRAMAVARETAAKKDSRALLVAGLVKKLQEPKDISAGQQVGAVLDVLDRSAELRPEHLQLAADVLSSLPARPPFAELVCLRRLSEFAERVQARDPDSWPAEKAQALLQAMRRREQVMAALSRAPGLLHWVTTAVEQADALRHRGEQQLLWERPSHWAVALAALQAARESYQQAGETLQTVVAHARPWSGRWRTCLAT